MTGSIITLTQHIIDEQRRHPGATGKFTDLMNDIAFAAKMISYHTNKAGLLDILGTTGDVNVQGEEVKRLDEFAHDTMVNALSVGGNFCALASEEEEEVIPVPDDIAAGKYVCLFDPLDGSSNIDANVSVGTIFSVYRRLDAETDNCSDNDLLQPGKEQVCAGYVIYGSSTMLVYTTGAGVNGFTLDPGYGEFVLSHPNMKTPDRAKIYSVNEGNYGSFEPGIQKYIDFIKEEDRETGRPFSSRYIGSMVSDIHRNLLYGGIFMYPATASAPKGKLRLMYEANPIAFVYEQAGGAATDGNGDILDIEPESIHQRTPVFIGPKYDIEQLKGFLSKQHEKI